MVKRNTDGTLFVGEVIGDVKEIPCETPVIEETADNIKEPEPEKVEPEIVEKPKVVIKRPAKKTETAKKIIKRK